MRVFRPGLCGARVARVKVRLTVQRLTIQLMLFQVYAYMPTTQALCDEDEITCNDDYGVSIARGSFGFVAGKCVYLT